MFEHPFPFHSFNCPTSFDQAGIESQCSITMADIKHYSCVEIGLPVPTWGLQGKKHRTLDKSLNVNPTLPLKCMWSWASQLHKPMKPSSSIYIKGDDEGDKNTSIALVLAKNALLGSYWHFVNTIYKLYYDYESWLKFRECLLSLPLKKIVKRMHAVIIGRRIHRNSF